LASKAASSALKNGAEQNDMLERLAADSEFGVSIDEMRQTLDVRRFIGRAPEQVDEFLNEIVVPQLKHQNDVEHPEEVRV
jgi:adenylosuccinate lyase